MYKTYSICYNIKEIETILVKGLGYTKTNIRNIIINDLKLYKTNKELLKDFKIPNNTLYTPLVYRDEFGHSLLVGAVESLLARLKSESEKRITCYSLWFYDAERKYPPVNSFRAETVLGNHMRRVLSQHNLLKNEKNSDYLP